MVRKDLEPWLSCANDTDEIKEETSSVGGALLDSDTLSHPPPLCSLPQLSICLSSTKDASSRTRVVGKDVVQRNEADVYRLKPGLNRLCRRAALTSLSLHSFDQNQDIHHLKMWHVVILE